MQVVTIVLIGKQTRGNQMTVKLLNEAIDNHNGLLELTKLGSIPNQVLFSAILKTISLILRHLVENKGK